MNTYKKLLIPIVVIISVIGLGFWNIQQKNKDTSIQNEKVVQEFKAVLVIEDGKINPSFDIQQYIGTTVLETTQKVLNGNIKITGTGENAFVTSINGRDANSKKYEFWELLINGKQAEKGAGSIKIQNLDNIVWKISTFK